MLLIRATCGDSAGFFRMFQNLKVRRGYCNELRGSNVEKRGLPKFTAEDGEERGGGRIRPGNAQQIVCAMPKA